LGFAIVFCFACPDGRGWMRTEESATHADTTAEDAWNLYASRCTRRVPHRFGRSPMDAARNARIENRDRTVGGIHASPTNRSARRRFYAGGNGVSVTLALWANGDFCLN